MRLKAQEITPSAWHNGAYIARNTVVLLEYIPKIKSKIIVNFVKYNESKPSKRAFRGLRVKLVFCAKNKASGTELIVFFDYNQHCYD